MTKLKRSGATYTLEKAQSRGPMDINISPSGLKYERGLGVVMSAGYKQSTQC